MWLNIYKIVKKNVNIFFKGQHLLIEVVTLSVGYRAHKVCNFW